MTNCFLTPLTMSGIKNIEKPITIDFYKKTVLPFSPEEYKVKAIYGENGAGKSAIITALSIVQNIILRPNYLIQEKTQNILNELINKNTERLSLSLTFLLNLETDMLRQYRYDVVLAKKESEYVIADEACYERNPNSNKNRFLPRFEQKDGKIVFCDNTDSKFTDVFDKDTANLLQYQLAASIVFRQRKEYSANYWNAVTASLSCVVALFVSLAIHLSEEDRHEIHYSRERVYNEFFGEKKPDENGNLTENLYSISQVGKKRIPKADFEKSRQNLKKLLRFVQLFKRDLLDIDYQAKDAGEYYECEMILDYGGKKKVSLEYESTGIKKIISLYDAFCQAKTGYIVFIDEMDANINEVYLEKLVEFFQLYGEGQLCFTTHNLSTMDVLRKNKKSIEYLTSENEIITWTARGNLSPINDFKRGNIPGLPFNIEASDFLGIIGD